MGIRQTASHIIIAVYALLYITNAVCALYTTPPSAHRTAVCLRIVIAVVGPRQVLNVTRIRPAEVGYV